MILLSIFKDHMRIYFNQPIKSFEIYFMRVAGKARFPSPSQLGLEKPASGHNRLLQRFIDAIT